MANTMFMGTRERMVEIPCPSVSMPSSKVGYNATSQFLNGGAYVRRSLAASKRYEMTWNSLTRDSARTILDIADGLCGLGEIYWHDPFTADKNVLPQSWASPMQGAYDALPLIGNDRPLLSATTTNTNNFPVQSALYTCSASLTPRKIWIPIPTGYTAYVGAFGSNGTGGTVIATPTIDSQNYGTSTNLTLMSVTNTARTNYSVANSGTYNGVELKLGGTGTVLLAGMIVQVLKTGTSVQAGGFISGQGNSGCIFEEQPTYTPYSAAFDNVGMSAKLVEIGMWNQ